MGVGVQIGILGYLPGKSIGGLGVGVLHIDGKFGSIEGDVQVFWVSGLCLQIVLFNCLNSGDSSGIN